jgi:hypothetical protein
VTDIIEYDPSFVNTHASGMGKVSRVVLGVLMVFHVGDCSIESNLAADFVF